LAEQVTPEDLVRIAGEAFNSIHGAAGSASAGRRPGTPARVTRLDRPGHSYWLIPIRDAGGLRGIVQVSEDGMVESVAPIEDPTSVFLVGPDAALAAARRQYPAVRAWGKPYLGWRPSAQSFDSMRPVWVVPHGDEAVYVGQDGEVSSELVSPGRGG
jgi:hypothetical protein